MSTELFDVLLVGYGAVGVMHAYMLENSKRARVTAVARGNFSLIQDKGVNIESGRVGHHTGWKPYRTLSSVKEAADRKYAYVVVTTKALPDVLRTAELLAPFLTSSYAFPQPTYVLVQNGLGVEDDLYAAAKALKKGEPVIITSAVFIDANLTDTRDGVQQHTLERLIVGLYTPRDSGIVPTTEASAALQTFADIMHAGGSDAAVADDVQYEKFMKNRWNAVISTMCSLVRYPPPALSATEHVEAALRPVLHAVITEISELGKALGHPMVESDVDALVERTLTGFSKTSSHKPSMLVDVERGSPIEVEVIVGTLVRWGKEKGVPMPRMETIYALLCVIQGQAIQKH